MTELLPPGFLFRVALPVKRLAKLPAEVVTPPTLNADFALPNVGELAQGSHAGSLRVGWHDSGLAFQLEVQGRKTAPRCDYGQVLNSDGLQIWIDTRNTQNIHRASKFCHHFCVLPSGASRDRSLPVAKQIPIARAREEATLCDSRLILTNSEVRDTGYSLGIWLPAECLNGYAPDSNPHLGFYFLIRDRELGDQYLSIGAEFPFDQDPSLWWTLDLI
ncbi:MAG: hypothetical protein JWM11_5111 [Planctomycetaceae bacterium]|nr:hypothetical protein [Planctomycetaceae bacterium]